MQILKADVGTVYVGYADAVAWVSPMSPDALEDFIVRMGEKPRHDYGLQNHAIGIIREEFRDRTLSCRIVRNGEPTAYDRDPRAIAAIEKMLEGMERVTGGYAFEQEPEITQAAVWTAMDIAKGFASAAGAGDLHAYLRALQEENDLEFENPADWRVMRFLQEAIAIYGIEDATDLQLRYLGGRDGFVTEAAYQELLRTEGPARRAVSAAAQDFWRRYGHACGLFDFGQARESFLQRGDARYYLISSTSSANNPKASEIHAELAARRVQSERFRDQEREKGYSPYGYWFSPEGIVHPMKGFQIHDTWIRGKLDGGPGLEGRYAALAAGWVSMTMMDALSPGANIAYGDGSACQKALKAAARIVRRGGEFSSVVIESYQGLESAGYEVHDDHKLGARKLNEIAGSVSAVMRP